MISSGRFMGAALGARQAAQQVFQIDLLTFTYPVDEKDMIFGTATWKKHSNITLTYHAHFYFFETSCSMVPKERSNMLKYDQIVSTHNKAREKKPFKTCFRTGFSMDNDHPESCWVDYIIPKLIHQPSIMSQLYQICVHMLIIKTHIKQLSSSTNHSQSPFTNYKWWFLWSCTFQHSKHVVFLTQNWYFGAEWPFAPPASVRLQPSSSLPGVAYSSMNTSSNGDFVYKHIANTS